MSAVIVPQHTARATWVAPVILIASTGLAFCLYGWTAATGLTWANHGADGGELIAAALVNGVPHPPGYPLYIWLLQGWLALGNLLLGGANPARMGSFFSAFCAAASVFVTVMVAAHLLRRSDLQPQHPLTETQSWLWAGLIGVAWAVAPLPWSQAVITEVYALQMLLVALLGWAVLVQTNRPVLLTPIVALALANHLTIVLLLPAVIYLSWSTNVDETILSRASLRTLGQVTGWVLLGVALGALLYVRLPLVAAAGPPINWGYSDNWAGFWWLVSAQAYRGYLFNVPVDGIFNRVAQWANTLTTQYTPVGLGLALVGLAHLDETAPRIRNFSLLWTIPLSIYSISYYTRDSEIYLLPIVWLMAIWLAFGLPVSLDWLTHRWSRAPRYLGAALVGVVVAGMIMLIGLRIPEMSLRGAQEAQHFLDGVAAVVEPDSIIISSGDAETFALWYGVWGSRELVHVDGAPVLINYALLQFDWYRRLIAEQYPHIPGLDGSIDELLHANAQLRPIFFAEELSIVPAERLQPVGNIWRYVE